MKFWGWFTQRITGIALVVLVGLHVYLAYFASPGNAVTYEAVQERIRSSAFAVDMLLLYLGLFHGLYGLRVVVTDLVPQWKGAALSALFVVGGLGLSVYGTTTLMALR